MNPDSLPQDALPFPGQHNPSSPAPEERDGAPPPDPLTPPHTPHPAVGPHADASGQNAPHAEALTAPDPTAPPEISHDAMATDSSKTDKSLDPGVRGLLQGGGRCSPLGEATGSAEADERLERSQIGLGPQTEDGTDDPAETHTSEQTDTHTHTECAEKTASMESHSDERAKHSADPTFWSQMPQPTGSDLTCLGGNRGKLRTDSLTTAETTGLSASRTDTHCPPEVRGRAENSAESGHSVQPPHNRMIDTKCQRHGRTETDGNQDARQDCGMTDLDLGANIRSQVPQNVEAEASWISHVVPSGEDRDRRAETDPPTVWPHPPLCAHSQGPDATSAERDEGATAEPNTQIPVKTLRDPPDSGEHNADDESFEPVIQNLEVEPESATGWDAVIDGYLDTQYLIQAFHSALSEAIISSQLAEGDCDTQPIITPGFLGPEPESRPMCVHGTVTRSQTGQSDPPVAWGDGMGGGEACDELWVDAYQFLPGEEGEGGVILEGRGPSLHSRPPPARVEHTKGSGFPWDPCAAVAQGVSDSEPQRPPLERWSSSDSWTSALSDWSDWPPTPDALPGGSTAVSVPSCSMAIQEQNQTPTGSACSTNVPEPRGPPPQCRGGSDSLNGALSVQGDGEDICLLSPSHDHRTTGAAEPPRAEGQTTASRRGSPAYEAVGSGMDTQHQDTPAPPPGGQAGMGRAGTRCLRCGQSQPGPVSDVFAEVKGDSVPESLSDPGEGRLRWEESCGPLNLSGYLSHQTPTHSTECVCGEEEPHSADNYLHTRVQRSNRCAPVEAARSTPPREEHACSGIEEREAHAGARDGDLCVRPGEEPQGAPRFILPFAPLSLGSSFLQHHSAAVGDRACAGVPPPLDLQTASRETPPTHPPEGISLEHPAPLGAWPFIGSSGSSGSSRRRSSSDSSSDTQRRAQWSPGPSSSSSCGDSDEEASQGSVAEGEGHQAKHVCGKLSELTFATGERLWVCEEGRVAYCTLDLDPAGGLVPLGVGRDTGVSAASPPRSETFCRDRVRGQKKGSKMPHKTTKTPAEGRTRAKHKDKSAARPPAAQTARKHENLCPEPLAKSAHGTGHPDLGRDGDSGDVVMIETVVITEKTSSTKCHGSRKKKKQQSQPAAPGKHGPDPLTEVENGAKQAAAKGTSDNTDAKLAARSGKNKDRAKAPHACKKDTVADDGGLKACRTAAKVEADGGATISTPPNSGSTATPSPTPTEAYTSTPKSIPSATPMSTPSAAQTSTPKPKSTAPLSTLSAAQTSTPKPTTTAPISTAKPIPSAAQISTPKPAPTPKPTIAQEATSSATSTPPPTATPPPIATSTPKPALPATQTATPSAVPRTACALQPPTTCSSTESDDDIIKRRQILEKFGGATIRTKPKLPEFTIQLRNEETAVRGYSEVVKQKTPPQEDAVQCPRVVLEIQASAVLEDPQSISLWCEFSTVKVDASIRWTKEGVVLSESTRGAGGRGRDSLTLQKASRTDLGRYQCSLTSAHGNATANYHLTSEVLNELVIPSHDKEECKGVVVEEVVGCAPLHFKEDFLCDQYFGAHQPASIVTEKDHFGEGMHRRAFRTTLQAGMVSLLPPGHQCVLKVHNAISHGTNNNEELVQRNYNLAVEECHVQNTAREYIKAYRAVARGAEAFGEVPEIIPIYLVHRPSNDIPYATLEEELIGDFVKYSVRDGKEVNLTRRDSEAGQKCCAFQHWVYEKTDGNLLVTDMQGVGMKLTDVGIATCKKGYKGFRGNCATSFIDQFKALHQCNRFCELLGMTSLQPKPKRAVPPPKPKAQPTPKKKPFSAVLKSKS